VEHELIKPVADKDSECKEGQLHPVSHFSDVCPSSGHMLYYYGLRVSPL
jgi:hypothetical protein